MGIDFSMVTPTFSAAVKDISSRLDVLKTASSKVSEVDVEAIKADASSTSGVHQVLKEGMTAAQTPEERMRYAKMACEADIRQKEASDQKSVRAHDTQQGIVKLALIAGGAVVAGTALLINKK